MSLSASRPCKSTTHLRLTASLGICFLSDISPRVAFCGLLRSIGLSLLPLQTFIPWPAAIVAVADWPILDWLSAVPSSSSSKTPPLSLTLPPLLYFIWPIYRLLS